MILQLFFIVLTIFIEKLWYEFSIIHNIYSFLLGKDNKKQATMHNGKKLSVNSKLLELFSSRFTISTFKTSVPWRQVIIAHSTKFKNTIFIFNN